MKKYFKMATLALAVLGLTVACKQKPAEEAIDTMPIDTMPLIEEVVDSIEDVVTEEVKPVVKKATTQKKEETKKNDGFATRSDEAAKSDNNIMQKAPTTDNTKRSEVTSDKVMQKADQKNITKTSKN